uniref:Uncharacterized protein n=1 Tax=Gloeothece verrucosa (strain PCC 7822) TaxID=497965 RepID=E0UJI2_GLOV7|nr:hypothetical protein Cyan7822_5115 [Gloeothece verrucosa PCC 7822]
MMNYIDVTNRLSENSISDHELILGKEIIFIVINMQ